MGSKRGIQYRYRFWIDRDIIPYHIHNAHWTLEPSTERKSFLFEIRTNFILKTRTNPNDNNGQTSTTTTIMDSERFGAWLQERRTGQFMEERIDFRLKDYWMSDNEIRKLTSDAKYFAEQKWQKECADSTSDLPCVVPVVVALDVCTVQQEGETIEAAVDRAIKAERMIPLQLLTELPNRNKGKSKSKPADRMLQRWLLNLQRSRVEDVDEGMGLMEVCTICLLKPTIGAQICRLNSCGHAFHTHCLVRWVERRRQCPLCRTKLDLV